MKDIKKLLSEQAKDILPDEKVKESIKSEIFADCGQKAYAGGGTEVKKSKNGLYAVIAAFIAVVIILCVSLPVIFKNAGTPGLPVDTISAADDFYAYGAASAGSILSRETSGQTETSSSVKATAAKTAAKTAADADEQQAIDLVNEYIYYIEELLGESSVTYSTASASSDSGYQYSMEIQYKYLLGETVSYTMYFNETQTDSKTDGDETETSYDIEGILVVNDISYPVEGGRSSESETGETENKIWFKAYTGDNSFILIKQEYEEETDDGEYEVEKTTEIYTYENGICVESIIAETESEDSETELELEITRDNVKNTLECKFSAKNGETVIEVEAKINGTKYSFKIYVEDGYYTYVFDDGEYKSNR
ncbi:MAG: hypothetical protein LUD27_00755 [Clostridia bacterium]|nr:hypothetical protein [Clostridia bacterium]